MSACKALNSSWEVSHLEYVILTDCVSDAAKIRGRGTEEALNARPTLRSQFCQSVSCVVVDTLFALYSSCCTEIFFITFGKCISRLQTLMDLATLPLSREEQLHA